MGNDSVVMLRADLRVLLRRLVDIDSNGLMIIEQEIRQLKAEEIPQSTNH